MAQHELGFLFLGQKVKDFYETEAEQFDGRNIAMGVIELENGVCLKFPLIIDLTAVAVPDANIQHTSVIVN